MASSIHSSVTSDTGRSNQDFSACCGGWLIHLLFVLALRLLCLPHLRPPRLLSLSYFLAGGSGHSVFAVLARRRVSIQFAQDRNSFVQLREFFLCLCSLTLQHLD